MGLTEWLRQKANVGNARMNDNSENIPYTSLMEQENPEAGTVSIPPAIEAGESVEPVETEVEVVETDTATSWRSEYGH